MDYLKYKNILEFIPQDTTTVDVKNELLYNEIYKFLYILKETKILISLSGGVDSMVLLEIMCKIREVDSIEIICCHLNYNNREESIIERNFLKEYCENKNIVLEIMDFDFKRGSIKRNKYEELTRNMRYNYYKQLCDKYDAPGVFLGHHSDDVCENIFNNVMRAGREITDLIVLKKENIILDVVIYRPLLDFNKSAIYDFSHKYQIPYFLDTTPDWSCRGKMRNQIFPSCEDCYGENYKKALFKIGNEGEELGNIIQRYLIDDLFDSVIFEENNFKIIYKKCLREKYILRNLLTKITNYLRIDHIKQKNIEQIIQLFKYAKSRKLCVLNNYNTYFDNNILHFYAIK